MTWLNPAGWWWLLVAVPVIALYILRIRRRRTPVSTLQFWEEAVPDSRPRAWWQRLRNLVSLLVQLLFLLLVVMAIADPLTAKQKRERRTWLLIIDRSASMQMSTNPAMPGAPTRLDQAKTEAVALINRLRDWDEAMVATMTDRIDVRCGRTDDARILRRAVASIATSDAPGDAREAIRLAAGVRVDDRKQEVVVWSDQPAPSGEAGSLSNGTWRVTGAPVDNVGIVTFAARPAAERRDRVRLLLAVANHAATNRSFSVSLRENGIPFDAPFFEVPPGEERSIHLEHEPGAGGLVTAELMLDQIDGFAGDNRAQLVVESPRAVTAGLVTSSPNRFLVEVLEAQPLLDLVVLSPDDPDGWTVADLLVFDRVVPDMLPAQAALYLGPEAASPLWSMDEPVSNAWVNWQNEASPLTRHVPVEELPIARMVPIRPIGGEVLWKVLDRPAAVAWQRGDHRVVAWTIDLQRSDVPLRTAFPIFVANCVNWLADRSVKNHGAFAAGDLVTLARAGDAEAALVAPDGTRSSLPDKGDHWLIGPVERAGVYRVEADADATPLETFAVNLANGEESNGRTMTDEDAAAPPPWLALGARRSPWFYLALAALLLSVTEWLLHHRRVLE